MKKIVCLILIIISFIITIPFVYAESKTKEPVKVYMFTMEKCDACDDGIEYFKNLEKEHPDLLELYVFEVWDKDKNVIGKESINLMVGVYDYYQGDKNKPGTPTIVIGEYFSVGLTNNYEELYEAIIEASENENYVDHVQVLAGYQNIDIEKIKYVEDNNEIQIIILATIIMIIFFGGLFWGLILIKTRNK